MTIFIISPMFQSEQVEHQLKWQNTTREVTIRKCNFCLPQDIIYCISASTVESSIKCTNLNQLSISKVLLAFEVSSRLFYESTFVHTKKILALLGFLPKLHVKILPYQLWQNEKKNAQIGSFKLHYWIHFCYFFAIARQD